MIHHAGLEIAAADVDRAVELFVLLGFVPVPVPPTLGGGYTWLEREGTQIHLMHDESPVAPPRGHVAVVTPDFDATLAALREHGFETALQPEHWDVPRALASAPGGHRVELMEAPPARQV